LALGTSSFPENPQKSVKNLSLGITAAVFAVALTALLGAGRTPKPHIHFSAGVVFPPSPVRFLEADRRPLPPGLPRITHVQVIDLDADGTAEIVACDALRNRISRLDRGPDGSWRETTLIAAVGVPAHATFTDIDADDDLDCLVSILGDINPSDAAVGQVELYRLTDTGYEREVLLDGIRRVADVQPADFDADGDVDLAVAVFGYSRGEILWLENQGDGSFADHLLHAAPGGIHVPIADYDGDGDPDIATVISQDDEEIWAFENLGQGRFRSRMLWRTPNFDLGSAGLVVSDLDRDGDQDLILPVGDNLEDFAACPQPYHGCLWFENRGDWQFTEHRIADLAGTYAASVGDLDGDGDLDIALVSMANDWNNPAAASLVWLENDGHQQFRTRQIASDPIHLVCVDTGDVDGDGRIDLVTGSLNLRPPFERIGGVSVWLNRGPAP
jgi:hypothetical protein